MLKGQKTQKEYNMCLRYKELAESSYTSWYLKEAARIMKSREIQNIEVLKQIRDSLLTDVIYRLAKESFESLQISNEMIKMIGFLDMKECVPTLKQQLSGCIGNERRREREIAYRHALARLGDKEQRQYLLDNLMEEFDRRDFSYFREDEIMWKYIEVNYSFDKYFWPTGDSSCPIALLIMSDIYPYITDVPEGLKFPDLSRDMNEHYQWAKSLHDWLMANKEKVKFNYDGEKKWFW